MPEKIPVNCHYINSTVGSGDSTGCDPSGKGIAYNNDSFRQGVEYEKEHFSRVLDLKPDYLKLL